MKTYWSIDRVRQLTESNVLSDITFLYSQDGKKYNDLSPAAVTYFKKQENPKYFGQIITNINMLGFILRKDDQTFRLSSAGRYLYSKPHLIGKFLEYSLIMFQYPRPHLTADQSFPTSKPYILILKLLLMLHDKGGAKEAYFTEQEFIYLFSSRIRSQSDITVNLIEEILKGNRQWAKSISGENYSGKLNYDKAYFLNSEILTSDETDFQPAPEKFMFGLKSDPTSYSKALFIVNHFSKNVFSLNPYGGKDAQYNRWSNYISNARNFLNYLSLMNMIETLIPFNEYCKSRGYYFEDDLIRRFIMSLTSKKYLILTGISGSGKSKIAELFGTFLISQGKGNLLVKAVGSNWNDSKNLLGYVNPLLGEDKNYSKTEVVNFIEEANGNPDKTYLFLLDEMNLSYTERYFSDFLSALESLSGEITLPNGIKLKWPENLKIVGTINEDETTHTLSPKVIDRANIIEMNGSKPSQYFNMLQDRKDPKVQTLCARTWYKEFVELLDSIFEATNGKFGYRVMNEIVSYVELNDDSHPETGYDVFLDEQIYQKILPKIHGARSEVKDIIDKLEQIFTDKNLKMSLSKLSRMKTMLKNTGFTSFVNS